MKNLVLTGIAMLIIATQLDTGTIWLGIVEMLLLLNFIFEGKKHFKM